MINLLFVFVNRQYRILTENPHLLQMYKDLVITQVLTSEEFWTTHATRYTHQQNSQKQQIGMCIAPFNVTIYVSSAALIAML